MLCNGALAGGTARDALDQHARRIIRFKRREERHWFVWAGVWLAVGWYSTSV